MGTPTLDIRLKRPSKIYHEGESVSGIIVISCLSETRHDGIHLTVDGIVNLELSSKSVGQYESFYNSVKSVKLVDFLREPLKYHLYLNFKGMGPKYCLKHIMEYMSTYSTLSKLI